MSYLMHLRPLRFPGKLLSFDGLDGSGKSTCVKFVGELLREAGVPSVTVGLPSKDVRKLELFRRYADNHGKARERGIDPLAISVLLDADILNTIRATIIPALMDGVHVVTDRYIFASVAEMHAHGCESADLLALQGFHSAFPRPDFPFVCCVNAATSLQRVRARPDEAGFDVSTELWDAFARGFVRVARTNEFIELDTGGPWEHTRAQLLSCLQPIIPNMAANVADPS